MPGPRGGAEESEGPEPAVMKLPGQGRQGADGAQLSTGERPAFVHMLGNTGGWQCPLSAFKEASVILPEVEGKTDFSQRELGR